MRVWFNKTFSSIHAALRLIRAADEAKRYTLLASSPNPHALVALAADVFAEEPAGLTGAAYVDWCADFCVAHEVGIFIPGKEAALLAEAAPRFEAAGVRIMACAPRPMLDLIHDKARFYATVDCPEAPAPDGRVVEDFAGFEAALAALEARHTALCLKPAVGVYGIGFRRIRQDKSAYDIFAGGHDYQIDRVSLRAMLAAQGRFAPLLLMEYLGGHEYSVDCLADRGLLRAAVARKKPKTPGAGQCIDASETLQAACRRVCAQFSLNGYANIQFRAREDGALRILEVNPRLSGGIGMAALSGVNLPYLGLRGFDEGYAGLTIPAPQAGLRVGEYNQATVLMG